MPSETLISHFKPSTSPLNSSKPPTPTTTSPPPPPPPTAAQPMICTAKSSNWLDRLRSSRGFPDSDHIDLEHFLSISTDKTDSSVTKFTCKKPLIDENLVTEKRDDYNKSVQERDLINNVLSELFYMGECEEQSRIKMEKSCRNRKQLCPRIHVVSANSDVRNVTAARKERFSLSSGRKVKEVGQVKECVGEGEGEEKGGRDCDLSAYSQTEVTVIDTSVPCWKFEKVLYRSKNVWKVGDRKGKGLMNGDKKRKERVSESGGNVPKKKLKKKMKLCNSLKADQERDQGKMVERNEKKRDNSSQLQEKSFCKKQIDEGSSVILIKSIPTTNKKNASGFSNGCVKSMQR